MKYCENCGVTIENNLPLCPLCKGETVVRGDDYELDFPAAPALGKSRVQTRLFVFFTLAVVVASVAVDLLIRDSAHWSYIGAGALVYLLLSIRYIRKSRRNIGLLLLIQILGISLLSFFVDLATGYYKWSMNYVIPFVIISAAGLLTFVLWARPRRFRDYILYQLGISVIGVGFSLYAMLDKSTVMWTGVVGIAYSLLTIVGVVVFSARKTRHELHKRFHF